MVSTYSRSGMHCAQQQRPGHQSRPEMLSRTVPVDLAQSRRPTSFTTSTECRVGYPGLVVERYSYEISVDSCAVAKRTIACRGPGKRRLRSLPSSSTTPRPSQNPQAPFASEGEISVCCVEGIGSWRGYRSMNGRSQSDLIDSSMRNVP